MDALTALVAFAGPGNSPDVSRSQRMFRRSGIRFADKDLRQKWNLRRFPFIWDHPVIPYERKTL